MKPVIADQIWTDYQPLSVLGLPLGRRLTVARSEDGSLVVFSPLSATTTRIQAIRSLGRVAAFVVPSRVHERFYEGYFQEFPEAKFLAGRTTIADHPDWPLTDIEQHPSLLSGFKFITLGGMPRLQELVFLHETTRTLIIADAFFNLPVSERWSTRLLMSAAGMGGKPRPSKLFKSVIKSKSELAASIRKILTWDFDRIIGGHGEIVETEGKSILRSAYDFLPETD